MYMLPDKIKKRNGDIVDFNAEKIRIAIEKAMTAVRGQKHTAEVRAIVESVLTQIEGKYPNRIPGVEDVQDLVEISLMEHRFFDVAKAYIVYRSEHQKIREEKRQETLEKIDRKELAVLRADGKKERFDKKKLREAFQEAVKGFEKSVDIEALTEQCTLAVYDGISTRDIERAMVLTARSFIERDPAYDTLAARLFLRGLMREVAGTKVSQKEWERVYRESFVANIKRAVALERLNSEMLVFDLEKLAEALN